jgi:hypothetical protein
MDTHTQHIMAALLTGKRVRVKELWDSNAQDEAVGREVKIGETGLIIEGDAYGDGDTWLVQLDEGGSPSYYCMDEIEVLA